MNCGVRRSNSPVSGAEARASAVIRMSVMRTRLMSVVSSSRSTTVRVFASISAVNPSPSQLSTASSTTG